MSVILRWTGKDVRPKHFLLPSPQRLVIDLHGLSGHGAASKTLSGIPGARLKYGGYADRVRIVLETDKVTLTDLSGQRGINDQGENGSFTVRAHLGAVPKDTKNYERDAKTDKKISAKKNDSEIIEQNKVSKKSSLEKLVAPRIEPIVQPKLIENDIPLTANEPIEAAPELLSPSGLKPSAVGPEVKVEQSVQLPPPLSPRVVSQRHALSYQEEASTPYIPLGVLLFAITLLLSQGIRRIIRQKGYNPFLFYRRRKEAQAPTAIEDTQSARLWYEILRVPESATDQEVKKSFRTLVKEFHGDTLRGSGHSDKAQKMADEQLRLITEAYDNIVKHRSAEAEMDEFRISSN